MVCVSQTPSAARDDVVDVVHGLTVRDPYRALEDASSAATKRWAAAQDGAARRFLDSLPGVEASAKRLQTLNQERSQTTPVFRNGRYFYMLQLAGEGHSSYYWEDAATGVATKLLDPAALALDVPVTIKHPEPSWDGELVAYQTAPNNASIGTVHVIEVDAGRELVGETIPNLVSGDTKWSLDGKGFYYVWDPGDPKMPFEDRAAMSEIRFHRIGTAPSDDSVVFPATGIPTTMLWLHATVDGGYLVVEVNHGWARNDLYVLPLTSTPEKPRPVVVGQNAIFQPAGVGSSLFLRTNMDAPRFRVLAFDLASGGTDRLREIVAEDDTLALRWIFVAGGHLIISTVRDASSELQVRHLNGELSHLVPLPTRGFARNVTPGRKPDCFSFSFQSFGQPEAVFEHCTSKQDTRVATTGSPLAASETKLSVDQVFFSSKDGTSVPMFLVRRRDLEPSPQVPALLHGYGGFGFPLRPFFSPLLFSWVESGGLLAVANVRGGNEYGEQWHLGGMLEKKQTTFDDFIAAAEWLVGHGYTSQQRLGFFGESNGGLAAAAIVTQRPDLFRAVVADAPLTDMVRYHLSAQGRFWTAEYGSPEDPAALRWLYAYSPYHQVKEGGSYPAVLVLTADSDDVVDPMHSRKLVAALQNRKSGELPNLLWVRRNAGHSGSGYAARGTNAQTAMLSFLHYFLNGGGVERCSE